MFLKHSLSFSLFYLKRVSLFNREGRGKTTKKRGRVLLLSVRAVGVVVILTRALDDEPIKNARFWRLIFEHTQFRVCNFFLQTLNVSKKENVF